MLSRETFTTSRLIEFCSRKELIAQTGHNETDWPCVFLKELIDNALDEAEEAGVAPEITVRVRVGLGSGSDSIVITDNGRGMDAAAADGQGVGLHSMQERVEGLRGSLAIRAAPGGSGTSIQVWVPLAQSTSLAHRGSASGSGAAVRDNGNV